MRVIGQHTDSPLSEEISSQLKKKMFKPFQNVLCEKKYVNNGTRVQERYTSYWLVKYYTVINHKSLCRPGNIPCNSWEHHQL